VSKVWMPFSYLKRIESEISLAKEIKNKNPALEGR
jgi:hypothetical protein